MRIGQEGPPLSSFDLTLVFILWQSKKIDYKKEQKV